MLRKQKQVATEPAPALLPVKIFAQRLGLSVWTVRQYAYRGRVASVKLGTRLLIPEPELARLISENMRPAVQFVGARQ